MAEKTAIYNLKAGIVVDRAVVVGLSTADLAVVLTTMRQEDPNKKLLVIDAANSFFTSDNLIYLIRAKDKNFELIAEHAGVDITKDHIAALWAADEATALIKGAMKPKWDFAPVPEGWSIAADLSLGPTRIMRKRNNSHGDNTTYRFSPEQAEKLWAYASKKWATNTFGGGTGDAIRGTDSYGSAFSRRAVVNATLVQLGCQIIRRYELEQLAKHRGWAFPAA